MRYLRFLFIIFLFALGASIAESSVFINLNYLPLRQASWVDSGFIKTQTVGLAEAEAEKQQQVIDEVAPSVISVFGVSEVKNAYFGENLFASQVTAGSGFFISSDGYILTNRHVVANEEAEYFVNVEGEKKLPAEVVYRHPTNDLAILKIEGSDYPVVELGDSSALKRGDRVVAMGNAFGQFPDTVSLGRVTALNRDIVAGDEKETQTLRVLQTSAQLYPGNSGGPLFDLEGRVVGVNVAMSAYQLNVSFSIPVNDVKEAVGNYMSL